MKRTHILWLAASIMLTSCDSESNNPDVDSTGSATFQINVHNRYGISVTSRADNDEEPESGEEGATAPEGIYDLKYLLADGNGNIIDHHYCRLEDDFSQLTLEGLKSGRYSIMFLGSSSEPIDAQSPAETSEAWLVNKSVKAVRIHAPSPVGSLAG